MHPSPLASHPFVLPNPSFSDLGIPEELQYTPRPKSASNWNRTRTSYLGGDLHDTIRRGDGIRRRRSRDDVRALIEFLRTQEPPPDNFMSTPYDDDDERGRWTKLRDIAKGRSKSMPRAPAPMRLPDSAVSGTTIGGHKHIAISIPLQASPFGERPRSQYPIYQDSEPVPSVPKGPIRTYMNERGVVTVLNPWAEGNEPRTPTSPYGGPGKAAPPRPLSERKFMSSPQLSMPPVPPPKGHLLTKSDKTGAAGSKPVDSSAQYYTHDLPLRPKTSGSNSKTSEFRRAEYPSRGSSMAANIRSHHHPSTSIDGIIAEEAAPTGRNPSPIPPPGAHLRRAVDRRQGTRDRPPVSLTTSPHMTRKSASNLRGEIQYEKEQNNRQSKVTLISQNPVVAGRDESPSPPPMAVSAKSRKDKVREKKLRDMEAARSSKLSLALNEDTEDVTDNQPATPDDDKPAPRKATSQPSLCPIMVVVDVKPDTEPEECPTSPEAEQIPQSPEPEVIESLPEDTKTGALVHTGNPTPPASTDNSPIQKYGFDTRTSLTRRREWNAVREQERKKREATALARTKLQQLAASGTFAGGMDAVTSDPEKEIFRLYEAYREHRLRDMERRVRRLERNGDVWLRALMPVLENMNQQDLAASVKDNHEDQGLRDWASDDEGTVERTSRVSERRRNLPRRASLSQGRMLEELMRQEKQEREAWNDNGRAVDDASGMGSIEPLMRELATGGSKFSKSAPRIRSGGAVHVV